MMGRSSRRPRPIVEYMIVIDIVDLELERRYKCRKDTFMLGRRLRDVRCCGFAPRPLPDDMWGCASSRSAVIAAKFDAASISSTIFSSHHSRKSQQIAQSWRCTLSRGKFPNYWYLPSPRLIALALHSRVGKGGGFYLLVRPVLQLFHNPLTSDPVLEDDAYRTGCS